MNGTRKVLRWKYCLLAILFSRFNAASEVEAGLNATRYCALKSAVSLAILSPLSRRHLILKVKGFKIPMRHFCSKLALLPDLVFHRCNGAPNTAVAMSLRQWRYYDSKSALSLSHRPFCFLNVRKSLTPPCTPTLTLNVWNTI